MIATPSSIPLRVHNNPIQTSRVSTTIFTVMSRLATQHKAINLGQGFPNFDPDPTLCALVAKTMAEGHNQYPYMPGVAPLCGAIAVKIQTLHDHAYDPETEITITSGTTEALLATVLATVNIGDEVVVIEPCYDSYLPAIHGVYRAFADAIRTG